MFGFKKKRNGSVTVRLSVDASQFNAVMDASRQQIDAINRRYAELHVDARKLGTEIAKSIKKDLYIS